MSAVIFAGPTIAPAKVEALLPGSVCWPPAGQGDLYRAAQDGPSAIGLIDGYFEGVPAVWHKEVLWAIDRGIPVYGSASMGALRAAELAAFGMRGVGQIFEAYRDGLLLDDDAVAVLHGPAETGYLGLSEALVNVEATLDKALADGAVEPDLADWLRAEAVAVFYQRRTWDDLLERAEADDRPVADLRAWLPEGRVDQKRADAEAMLEAMASAPEHRTTQKAGFAFAWTANWDEASTGSWTQLAGAGSVLDELRLEPDLYRDLRTAALLRRLSQTEASRRGMTPEPGAAAAALTVLRQRLGLATRRQLDDWFARNDLEPRDADRLFRDQALVQAVDGHLGPALAAELIDELRLLGDYPRLAERARRKERLRVESGLADPRPDDLDISPPALLAWYFHKRLNRSLPDSIGEWIKQLDLEDVQDFYRLVAIDYLYWREEEAS